MVFTVRDFNKVTSTFSHLPHFRLSLRRTRPSLPAFVICFQKPPIQYSVAMYGLVTKNPFLKLQVINLAFTATVSFFHSTAILERRKNPQNRFNSYVMRFRSKRAKQMHQRDIKLYLDHLLDYDKKQDDPQIKPPSYVSFFENQYFGKGTRKRRTAHTQGFHWEESNFNRNKGSQTLFWNDTDEDECEMAFGSAFRKPRDFYWSFRSQKNGRGLYRHDKHVKVHWDRTNCEPNREHFWKASFRSRCQSSSSDWKEYSADDGKETSSSLEALNSDRLMLGLTASGPLKLEEVKHAYRTCALRWHPDRHQGSSKVAAEEKFKCCTTAYKSICDQLLGDT